MRRLQRPLLEAALAQYLQEMQARIASGVDVAATWKAQRQSTAMKRIVQVLSNATGPRGRCMYCEDSRGTDVDHFRPKTLYRDQVFLWLNLLLICTSCNRCKGNRFPCDSAGNPLLIDPTADDPWDHLYFDPDTAEITARWDVDSGEESLRGRTVLEVLSTLRHQAVTEGRRRTLRALRRTVRAFLDTRRAAEDPEASEESIQDLLDGVDDAMDYGLAVWFFLRDGREESPFLALRRRFPAVWERILEHLQPRVPD